MHTDEYEISLSRELAVCRNKVGSIRRSLSARENKYEMTTGAFLEGVRLGQYSRDNKEFAGWVNDYEALKRWEALTKEYESAFRLMKI